MDNSFDKIKELLSEKFGVTPNLITLSASLRSELNLSDLEITDLISLCTTIFQLKLTEDINLDNFKTVGDLDNFIEDTSEDL